MPHSYSHLTTWQLNMQQAQKKNRLTTTDRVPVHISLNQPRLTLILILLLHFNHLNVIETAVKCECCSRFIFSGSRDALERGICQILPTVNPAIPYSHSVTALQTKQQYGVGVIPGSGSHKGLPCAHAAAQQCFVSGSLPRTLPPLLTGLTFLAADGRAAVVKGWLGRKPKWSGILFTGTKTEMEGSRKKNEFFKGT